MPIDFEKCRREGGRIRTVKVGKEKYQHICFKDGKSYTGEIKVRKAKGET